MPSYSPPTSVRKNAQRGLKLRKEYKRGGTEVGVARARDLSNGKDIPLETLKRMVSFFARHEVDKNGKGWNVGEEGYPSKGRIAWLLWGGDSGKAWAERIVKSVEMSQPAIVYARIPELDGFVECSATEPHASHRKELIYAGQFIKASDNGDNRQEIPVSKALLDHWAETGNRMLSKGIRIPVPVEHTTDPEKRRGSIVRFERGQDSKGREALFGYIKWRNEKDAASFSESDVSIFVPQQFIDANETVWRTPIRHVALTDYPVIHDLDGFETIAASFQEPTKMTFVEFAKALDITLEDGASEEDAQKLLMQRFKELMQEKDDSPENKPPVEADDPPNTGKPQPIAAGFIRLALSTRESQVNELLNSRKITPATAKQLKSQYCTEDAVSIALSSSHTSDAFDAVIATLAQNQPAGPSIGEDSPAQVISLSKDEIFDATKNPLLADAESRKA